MLSFIIPTKNEEKVLEKTIRSLRGLTVVPYEIIVSDGKSTDRTIEIAKQYADKVALYEGEKRQTIAMGRNLGAQMATGNYLVFVDADGIIPDINTFFSRALGFFEKDKNLLAYTVFLRITPNEAIFADNFFFGLVNRIYYVFNNVFHQGISHGDFQMIRTDAFKKVGGYNEMMVASEDSDLFFRLSKIGRTHIDPKLCIYLSPRRIRKTGWLKLLWSWHTNWLSMTFLHRAVSEEWKEVR